jgi:hypothetical protein
MPGPSPARSQLKGPGDEVALAVGVIYLVRIGLTGILDDGLVFRSIFSCPISFLEGTLPTKLYSMNDSRICVFVEE